MSSGRRRHWKNRTEINRSVFFAELEHELSLSLVLSQFSRLSSLSLFYCRPTRLASFYRPPSLTTHSFSLFRPRSPSVLLLVFQHLSFLPSLCLSYLDWLRSSPELLEFTLLLPDRPGRLRWTFNVDRQTSALFRLFRGQYPFALHFYCIYVLALQYICWNNVSVSFRIDFIILRCIDDH